MKHARSITTVASCVALALLAHPYQHNGQTGVSLSELYPGPLQDAAFGEILAGEFTGDLQLDAIVMDGLEPKLSVAPEIFVSAVGTGLAASAIAVLGGVVPGKDLLVAADQNGLHLLERDSAQGQWITTTLFDGSSAWAGAIELAVGDLDGLEGSDIAALNAAGNQVLQAFGAGDGTFVEGTPIVLGGPQIGRAHV